MEDIEFSNEFEGLESEKLARRSLGPVLNNVLARMEELGELPVSKSGERLWKLKIPDAQIFVIRTHGKQSEAWDDEFKKDEFKVGNDDFIEEPSNENIDKGEFNNGTDEVAGEPSDEVVKKLKREVVKELSEYVAGNSQIMTISTEYGKTVGAIIGDNRHEVILQLEEKIRNLNNKSSMPGLRPMGCAVHVATIDHLLLTRRGNALQIIMPGEPIVELSAALGAFDQIIQAQEQLRLVSIQENESSLLDATPEGYHVLYTNEIKGISFEAAQIEPPSEEQPCVLICGDLDRQQQPPFNKGREIIIRQEDLRSEVKDCQINGIFRGDGPFSISEVKSLLENNGITSMSPGERHNIAELKTAVRGKIDFSGSTNLIIEASREGKLGEMIEETEKYMDMLVRLGEILGMRTEQHTSDSSVFWALPEKKLDLRVEEGSEQVLPENGHDFDTEEEGQKLSVEERTLVFGWLAEKLYQRMSKSGEWLSRLQIKVIAQRLENVPVRLSMGQQGEVGVNVGGSDFNFETLMEKLAKRGFPEGGFRVSPISATRHFVMDKAIADAAIISVRSGYVTERKMNLAEETLDVCALDPGRSEFDLIVYELLAKDEKVKDRLFQIIVEASEVGSDKSI